MPVTDMPTIRAARSILAAPWWRDVSRVVKAKAKRKQRQAEIASLMDTRAQRKLEREAENHLIDLEERAQARYDWAYALKKQQSDEVQHVVNRMGAVMASLAK